MNPRPDPRNFAPRRRGRINRFECFAYGFAMVVATVGFWWAIARLIEQVVP